jgi:hypothetical protein
MSARGAYLRLLLGFVALGAGVAAVVVVALLLRDTIGY